MTKLLVGSLLALGLAALSPAAVTSASAHTMAPASVSLLAAHGGHHHWQQCHKHKHKHRVRHHHRWVWIWHKHHHCHGTHHSHH